MFKTLSITALVGIVGLAQPVSAEVSPVAGQFTTQELRLETSTELIANVILPTSADIGLYRAEPQAPALFAAQAEFGAITRVEDTAAVTPFWGPVDLIVVVMAALASVFIRLLVTQKRRPLHGHVAKLNR